MNVKRIYDWKIKNAVNLLCKQKPWMLYTPHGPSSARQWTISPLLSRLLNWNLLQAVVFSAVVVLVLALSFCSNFHFRVRGALGSEHAQPESATSCGVAAKSENTAFDAPGEKASIWACGQWCKPIFQDVIVWFHVSGYDAMLCSWSTARLQKNSLNHQA